MLRNYILCLLLSVAAAGHAQPYPSKIFKADTGKINLRWNVPGLVDIFDFNASTGGEWRFNKTWAVIMDAGYIFYSKYLARTEKARGMIVRPGVRLYTGKYRNLFFDLQFHYKDVRYYVNDWLNKDLVNNVATYQERMAFRDRKRVYGGQLTVGAKEFITDNYRLFVEYYAGFGVRYKEEGLLGAPDVRYDQGFAVFSEGTLTTHKRTSVLPSFPFGVRLVYTLR